MCIVEVGYGWGMMGYAAVLFVVKVLLYGVLVMVVM